MSRIGVVGVGNMGLAVACRLRDRGLAVTVRDIVPAREQLAAEAGCAVAPSAAAVAERCGLLLVVVVDAAQTREVLFGAGGAAAVLRSGQGVMLCPTIAPADVEDIAARLAATGVDVLDAPMSGGPLRARQGCMSLMVAAPDAVHARWQPLLEQIADPVFRVGARAGDGARTKLVNNLLAAVNLAGACEALALASRLGLDPATTLDVIERSSGQSWIGSDRLRRALQGRQETLAHVALLAKDSALAMAEVRRSGGSLPVGDAAQRAFAAAVEAGLAADDDSVLYRRALQLWGPSGG